MSDTAAALFPPLSIATSPEASKPNRKVARFLAAGYSRDQVMELPLDAAFALVEN